MPVCLALPRGLTIPDGAQVAVSNLDVVLLEARAAFHELSPHLLATLEQLYKALVAFADGLVPLDSPDAEGWEQRWLAARPSACSTSCGTQIASIKNGLGKFSLDTRQQEPCSPVDGPAGSRHV